MSFRNEYDQKMLSNITEGILFDDVFKVCSAPKVDSVERGKYGFSHLC